MEVPRPRSLSNRPTSTHIPDGPRLPFSWQQRGDTEAVAGTNNRKRLKYDSTFKGSRSRPPGSQTPHGIESAAKPQCSELEMYGSSQSNKPDMPTEQNGGGNGNGPKQLESKIGFRRFQRVPSQILQNEVEENRPVHCFIDGQHQLKNHLGVPQYEQENNGPSQPFENCPDVEAHKFCLDHVHKHVSCHDVSKNTNSIERVRHALSDRQFCNAYDRDEARPVFGSRPQVRMVVQPDVQREERTHVQEHKYSHADKYDKNSTKRVSFLGLQREEQKSDHADRHGKPFTKRVSFLGLQRGEHTHFPEQNSDHADRHGKPFTEHISIHDLQRTHVQEQKSDHADRYGKPFTEHVSIHDLQRTHVQEQKSDHAKRYGKPFTKHVPIHDLQREERTRVQEQKYGNEDRYHKPFTKHVSFLEEHQTEAQTTRSTSDSFAVKLGKCSASGSIHKKGRSDADSIPPNSQKPVPILKTVNHLDLPEIPFEAQIATTETVTYTELSALAHCLIYITMMAVNVVMLWSMLSCLANLA